MYKQNSEYKSIQKKLVAAVAMVLVACIMVVSSSYAWFTLSTAPEVTGIQTSVGSNGNLEMALRKTGTALDQIQSISSGGNTFPTVNTYWGNLVKLDESYGLNEISLAPARLNVTTGSIAGYETKTTVVDDVTKYTSDADDDTKQNKITVANVEYEISMVTRDAPEDDSNLKGTISYKVPVYSYTLNSQRILQTPTYGADGRISSLEGNTDVGYYENGKFVQGTAGTDLGVLAIGTVSGLTDEEIALRKAKDTVYGTIIQVQTDAGTSLSENASDLANIMITYYLNASATFTNTEYNQIEATITALNKIHDSLKNALDQTVIAVGVYQQKTITTVTYTADEIVTDGTAIDWTAEGLADPYESLKAAYADLAALKATIGRCVLPEKTGTYTGEALISAVTPLMTTDNLRILVGGNTYTVAQFKDAAFNNIGSIMTSGITVNVTGGVYGDIAEFVGNYEGGAEITVPGKTIAGFDEDVSVPTTMVTVVEAPSPYGYHLVYANLWLPRLVLNTTNSGGGTSLSDMYGYLIDFAFRTNATGSSLMLQTSAVDRISENNGTDATQGAGSYMQFAISTGNGYTLDQMIDLMKAIRIVFVDVNYKLVAVAALDVTTTEVLGTGDAAPAADTYDFTGADGKYYKFNTATYNAENGTVNAPINLYNYSFNDSGVCTLTTKIAANDSGATELMELVKNQATALSTLVYLDGDMVDNGDVAINGTSITGTMNLQFSSSATLVPMDYTFTETTNGTLATPAAQLTDNSLVITDATDAPTGVKYDIYTMFGTTEVPLQSGVSAGTYTVDLSSVTVGDESLPAGDYKIYVRATLSGYTSSTGVEAGTITIS